MSFADCFAAALAKQLKAHLVTRDPEFKQVGSRRNNQLAQMNAFYQGEIDHDWNSESTFAINRKDYGINYAGAADNLIRDEVVLTLHVSGGK